MMKHKQRFDNLRKQAESLLRNRERNPSFSSDEDSAVQLSMELDELIHELEVHQTELEMQNDELFTTNQALLEAEQRLGQIFDATPVAILVMNSAGIILRANILAQSLATATSNLRGKPFYSIFHIDDQRTLLNEWYHITHSSANLPSRPLMLRMKGNQTIWVRLEGCALSYAHDQEIAIVLHDITAQRHAENSQARAEAELMQAQKSEAIARLTSGIAHEFNNKLQIITGYSYLINAHKKLPERIYELLQHIDEASNNCDVLVKKLQTFSRQAIISPAPVSVHNILYDIRDEVSKTLPQSIEFRLILPDTAVSISTDRNQLYMCLHNLFSNARDALTNMTGIITLDCSLIQKPRQWLSHLGAYRQAGDYLEIVVSDTGCGMDEQALLRATEPFFSTKDESPSSGLGLSMVFGFMSTMQGDFEIQSTPGEGTDISLTLPIIPLPSPQVVTNEGSSSSLLAIDVNNGINPSLQWPGKRILVVDDEPLLRELSTELLECYGLDAKAFSNGPEIIRYLSEDPQALCDVILLDLVMPGMDGFQTGSLIHTMRPDIPIIVNSGYPGKQEAALNDNPFARAFLPKPYRYEELENILVGILGPASA